MGIIQRGPDPSRGASKLACEVLMKTYHRLYGLRILILRYANIVGPRLAHGVIVDFIRKLKANTRQLEILSDGTQKKSYMHVKRRRGSYPALP